MIAVTSNDSVNRVAVQIYQREFGRENVHAIRLRRVAGARQGPRDRRLLVRQAPLLGGLLPEARRHDHSIERATIEEENTTVAKLMARYPGVIPLFAINEQGDLRTLADDSPLRIGDGMIYLVDPDFDEDEARAAAESAAADAGGTTEPGPAEPDSASAPA